MARSSGAARQTQMSADDRKALLEEARREQDRASETKEQQWIRKAIREEIADWAPGFFGAAEDPPGDGDGDKGSGFRGLLGL